MYALQVADNSPASECNDGEDDSSVAGVAIEADGYRTDLDPVYNIAHLASRRAMNAQRGTRELQSQLRSEPSLILVGRALPRAAFSMYYPGETPAT